MRSPAVRSMSISRSGGSGLIWVARSMSSSVLSPMALTTTQTSLPAFLVSTIRRATRLTLSASATEEPPNFMTTRLTVSPLGTGMGRCQPSERSRRAWSAPHPEMSGRTQADGPTSGGHIGLACEGGPM